MAKETDIKNAIKDRLLSLERREIIRAVVVDDFRKGILERDYPAFPVAILQTAAIDNETMTNRENFRAYSFDIVVLVKGEDVTDATTVEDLRAAIMDDFDNDPTLGNVADGGVLPSSSPIEPVPLMGGKTFIAFTITIQARAIKSLTY
jgi:hypothetical protein